MGTLVPVSQSTLAWVGASVSGAPGSAERRRASSEGDPVAPETSVSVEVHATFLGMLAVQRSLDGPRG